MARARIRPHHWLMAAIVGAVLLIIARCDHAPHSVIAPQAGVDASAPGVRSASVSVALAREGK